MAKEQRRQVRKKRNKGEVKVERKAKGKKEEKEETRYIVLGK